MNNRRNKRPRFAVQPTPSNQNFSTTATTSDGPSTSSETLAAAPIMKVNGDLEIKKPPTRNVAAMEFSPASIQKNILVASSQDKTVRFWEIKEDGYSVVKSIIRVPDDILDVCYTEDGSNVCLASIANLLGILDVETNVEFTTLTSHNAPITTCNIIKSPNHFSSCILTGSLDKTLKIWDIRQAAPVNTIFLENKVCCVDVDYPMIVACLDQGKVVNFELTSQGYNLKKALYTPFESDRVCVAIFRDEITKAPDGFAIGNRQGRVTLIYNQNPGHEVFWLKCKNKNNLTITPFTKSKAEVNDVKFNPVLGALAVVRNNGRYAFWKTKPPKVLTINNALNQSIKKCCFNSTGEIFAYGIGYDLKRPTTFKSSILINPNCFKSNQCSSNNYTE